jgi:hypothetical protein
MQHTRKTFFFLKNKYHNETQLKTTNHAHIFSKFARRKKNNNTHTSTFTMLHSHIIFT